MDRSHRSRIFNMNPRIRSPNVASQENRDPLFPARTPRSLSQPTRLDPVLRPLSVYSSQKRKPLQHKVLSPKSSQQQKLANIADVVKLPEPVRAKVAAKVVSDYQSVEEDSVPKIIRDGRKGREFQKLGLLGCGAFARVYKVKAQNGKFYAAKVMSKASLSAKKIKKKILAEINIHRVLLHDFIVKFFTCFEDSHHVYLILELCENHTLAYMVRSRIILTEDETRYYMGQILSSLRYMSDNRIVHRDLKLANVLLDQNMDSKLCDFGLAALLLTKEERKRTVCGTPHYIAPEILQKTGHNHKVDMWSAGILMYNLLFGKHPFHHDSPDLLYQQVKRNGNGTEYSFPPTKDFDVSDDAKDLIRKLLVNDPDKRLNVIDALEHPFFSQHDIPDSIPSTALYHTPTHRQLFPSKYTNSQQTSRVAQAIDAAKSRTENYTDHRIIPPLKLMNEVVLDPRSQYPVQLETSQPINPTIIPVHHDHVYSTKRRNSDALSQIPKRLCTETRENTPVKPVEVPKPVEIPKIESLRLKKTVPASAAKQEFVSPRPLPHRKPAMEEMAENLRLMMDRASALPKELRKKRVREMEDFVWEDGNVFVQNWVDGSEKYGFSYRLSDGTLGLLFNDGTTLTTVDQKKYALTFRDDDNVCVTKTYKEYDFPPELEKKRSILKKFISYIESNHPPPDYSIPTDDPSKTHLFKYIVSDDAITFRLNNGVIQVNMFRKVKLILYDKGKKMMYIDQDKKIHHYYSTDVFNSTQTELIEALKVVYEILVKQNRMRQASLRESRWIRLNQTYKMVVT